MSAFLGLDVAQRSFTACLLAGDSMRKRKFDNEPKGYESLLEWLESVPRAEVRACMEATNVFHLGLANALLAAGIFVHVANPWTVKEYGKSVLHRTKTDPADAKLLALFCEGHPRLRPWTPYPPELSDLLLLVRHYEGLRGELARVRNRSRTARHPDVGDSLKRQVAALNGEMKRIQRAIAEHVNAHPALREHCALLRSIPGIGGISAPRILAELGNVERFDNVRQVAAYAGVTPQAHESGTSVRGKSKLCPLGSHQLRHALYMPAVVVFRVRKLFGAFIGRMLGQGRKPKTIIAAIMRKLLHLAYGVLKSGKPYDPHYGQDPPALSASQPGDAEADQSPHAHTSIDACATVAEQGVTEVGSAGEQPTKGYPCGTHRSTTRHKPPGSARSTPPSDRLPMPPKTQTAPTYG